GPQLARKLFGTLPVLTAVMLVALLVGAAPSGAAGSRDVSAAPAQAAAPDPATTAPLLVRFKPSAGSATIAAALRADGGQVLRALPELRTSALSVPPATRAQVLAAYQRDPAVDHVAAAPPLSYADGPNDPDFARQWALPASLHTQLAAGSTAKGAVKFA